MTTIDLQIHPVQVLEHYGQPPVFQNKVYWDLDTFSLWLLLHCDGQSWAFETVWPTEPNKVYYLARQKRCQPLPFTVTTEWTGQLSSPFRYQTNWLLARLNLTNMCKDDDLKAQCRATSLTQVDCEKHSEDEAAGQDGNLWFYLFLFIYF